MIARPLPRTELHVMPSINLPNFPSRFQFSLRNMLIAVAAIAVFLGLLAVAAGPLSWLITISVIWILPTPIVVTAVYGRGDFRAFAIGALIPWFSLWTGQYLGGSLVEMFAKTVQLLVVACVCEALAVVSRRWIERDAAR
jgi:hypothetical protein